MSNSIAPGSSADVNVRVTALTTNPNVPVTYKTVILKKNLVNGVNTLTQEMMSAQNTKYVIKYDYVLGEDITVPASCILEFDGGSITNGTIDLNNCQIIAPNECIFKNVTLQGTTNDIFNLVWIVDGDNVTTAFNNKPDSINRMVFRSTKVYYISDTVTFNNIYYLDWDVTIYYNGTKSNISVIRLNHGTGALVYFRGWFAPIDDTVAVDQVNDNTNVVGLEIICINDSEFHIGQIGYFNENLRVSALGAGCCENKFHIDRLYCANRHIRIYQEDVDGNIGWANENYFYGGHCFNFSSWTNQGKKACAIHIEGAGREGGTDNYNYCNALTFREFNVEGYNASASNGYTIYAKNISRCSFTRMRNEGGINLIKLVDGCSIITLESTFGPETADVSECSNANPFTNGAPVVIASIFDLTQYLKPSRDSSRKTSEIICGAGGAFEFWQTGSDMNGIGFDYSKVAGRILCTEHDANSTYIAFSKNGLVVDPFNGNRKSPFIFYDNTKGLSTATGHYSDSFYIPTGLDVDKVVIGAKQTSGRLIVRCSSGVLPLTRPIRKQGPYASVPTEAEYGNYSLPVGLEYYCTDTKKKILWNGTAWVNMDGSALS